MLFESLQQEIFGVVARSPLVTALAARGIISVHYKSSDPKDVIKETFKHFDYVKVASTKQYRM